MPTRSLMPMTDSEKKMTEAVIAAAEQVALHAARTAAPEVEGADGGTPKPAVLPAWQVDEEVAADLFDAIDTLEAALVSYYRPIPDDELARANAALADAAKEAAEANTLLRQARDARDRIEHLQNLARTSAAAVK